MWGVFLKEGGELPASQYQGPKKNWVASWEVEAVGQKNGKFGAGGLWWAWKLLGRSRRDAGGRRRTGRTWK